MQFLWRKNPKIVEEGLTTIAFLEYLDIEPSPFIIQKKFESPLVEGYTTLQVNIGGYQQLNMFPYQCNYLRWVRLVPIEAESRLIHVKSRD